VQGRRDKARLRCGGDLCAKGECRCQTPNQRERRLPINKPSTHPGGGQKQTKGTENTELLGKLVPPGCHKRNHGLTNRRWKNTIILGFSTHLKKKDQANRSNRCCLTDALWGQWGERRTIKCSKTFGKKSSPGPAVWKKGQKRKVTRVEQLFQPPLDITWRTI